MYEITHLAGLKQLVQEPTREDNLLDLAITDLMGTSIVVGGKIRDHKTVAATVPVLIPTEKKSFGKSGITEMQTGTF